MGARIRVATYNLYLGADLELLLLDGPGDSDPQATFDEVRRQLEVTAFPRRVDALAAAIAREAPDLVGLQEVCLWCADGQVLWDYEADLLAALARQGVDYEHVVGQRTFHGWGAIQFEGSDVRLDLAGSNTVLRRVDSPVAVETTASGLYGNAFTVPASAFELEATLDRGWSAARCRTADGTSFVFVDTHTEAYDDAARDIQRDELLGSLTDQAETVVIVGDFNEVPGTIGMPAGFVDAWVAAGNPSEGPEAATCCQAGDLRNEESALEERIDYVWVRGARVVSAARIGARPEERTPDGLWPSDHAGVVAELELTPGEGVGAPDRERLTALGRS
jgi:endonuclease/exonuclease/phosphatase family metal-dependent hydrolase